MGFNKRLVLPLLVLSMMFIIGCSTFNQMTDKNEDPGVSYIPLEQIVVSSGEVENATPAEPSIDVQAPGEEIKEETPAQSPIETITTPAEETAAKPDAATIIVQETEKVGLQPKGYDPDKDALAYTFTTPLDNNGEWQTTYGDEGEYRITVTASDGKLTASKDVLLIVNRKEEPPTIDSAVPAEKTLSVKENSKINFKITSSDLNKDELTYVWKLDGKDVAFETEYAFDITYDDAGSHTIKVDISDGQSATSNIWSITVENVNRPPVLEKLDDIDARETDTITIIPNAADPDGDTITYTISDPVGESGVWETTYDDAGVYEATVSASDGTDTVIQVLKISVENVNRPPVITEIVQKK